MFLMTYSNSSSFFIIDSDHFKIRRNTWLRMQVHLNHRISDNPRASLIAGFATYFTPVPGGSSGNYSPYNHTASNVSDVLN